MDSHLKSLCCSLHFDPFPLVTRAIHIFKLYYYINMVRKANVCRIVLYQLKTECNTFLNTFLCIVLCSTWAKEGNYARFKRQ